ncbi:HIT domain-containing protein, partial [Candidatus Woesearchaeota archaeon]|nr:HIT domain-containing protein [Candidatus Woesearchaeota archaeon]
MQPTPEQQKAIDQQKENCIFCQIISGKVPSKKVYEDKQVIGILDINPAAKGHVLLMPKEHYPIMPLIPPETFKHLVDMTKEVDRCVKESLLCKTTTIFIANGAAAGQQSSHFMLHIIPREGGDGLDMLDLAGKTAPESTIKEVVEK